MAHFRVVVQGSRGSESRLAGKAGCYATAQSWQGAITVRLFCDENGIDQATVEMHRHNGSGTEKILYDGPVGEFKPRRSKK